MSFAGWKMRDQQAAARRLMELRELFDLGEVLRAAGSSGAERFRAGWPAGWLLHR